jgi:hypothetical protein
VHNDVGVEVMATRSGKANEVPRRLIGERVVLRGPVVSDVDDRLAAGFDTEVVRLQGGEPSQFSEPMTRGWADS